MSCRSNEVEAVAALILQSSYTVVLTGAGVSTESGIPDFRSPGSGIWTVINPELFTIKGFKANPQAFYQAGLPFFKQITEAQPNRAHTALAALENQGLVGAVITQNVDGLHQKAGSSRVLEIHGSLRSASCLHCATRVRVEEVIGDVEEGIVPPLCVECGEALKPDVVLFGEKLADDYREAREEVRKADLLLVIGSSMQVSPANQLPVLCENLVIINRTPTFYDDQARVVLGGSIPEVMTILMKEIDRLTASREPGPGENRE